MARIEFDGAAVTVNGSEGAVPILRPTDLELTEQRVAVIGANGSGKSTLARMLNGLVHPTSGHVRIDGADTVKSGHRVRRRVGFVFTDPEAQLVMPTVAEDVALSLRRSVPTAAQRRARALDVLEQYGLGHLADVSVHVLSGGQKQLLALAGVLATDPDVVVADEPTTLLDLRNTLRIADLLFSLPQQLILVTHDLDLAARCERGILVEAGAIAYDGAGVDAVAHYRDLVNGP